MKTACIIQARMGSTRFPGKNLAPILNTDKPNPVCALELIDHAAKRSIGIDQTIIACPNSDFDIFVDWAKMQKEYTGTDIKVFGGFPEDVYRRVLYAARQYGVDTIVDITGDCPLVPVTEINALLKAYNEAEGTMKYISNVFPHRLVPDGWDVQIYSTDLMEAVLYDVIEPGHSGWNIYKAVPEACLSYPRTSHFWRYAHLRITLDTPEDLAVIQKIAAFYIEQGYLNSRKKAKMFLSWLSDMPEEWWDNRNIKPKEAGEG